MKPANEFPSEASAIFRDPSSLFSHCAVASATQKRVTTQRESRNAPSPLANLFLSINPHEDQPTTENNRIMQVPTITLVPRPGKKIDVPCMEHYVENDLVEHEIGETLEPGASPLQAVKQRAPSAEKKSCTLPEFTKLDDLARNGNPRTPQPLSSGATLKPPAIQPAEFRDAMAEDELLPSKIYLPDF